MKKNNQLTLKPKDNSIEFLISQAIKQKTPVETFEKLLKMRKELKAEFAKEQFDSAMADFQGECPTIKKNKAGGMTKFGKIAYHYAPLEKIVEQTKELLKKYCFSYLIKTEMTEKGIRCTCIAKHRLGHTEESSMEVPLSAGTNIMSAGQITASATTFAKRYAFCNAFGIMTGDSDDDANATKYEKKAYSKKQFTPPMSPPDYQETIINEDTPWLEEVKPENMIQCDNCGDIISEKVFNFSKNKFQQPLCIKCQKNKEVS